MKFYNRLFLSLAAKLILFSHFSKQQHHSLSQKAQTYQRMALYDKANEVFSIAGGKIQGL